MFLRDRLVRPWDLAVAEEVIFIVLRCLLGVWDPVDLEEVLHLLNALLQALLVIKADLQEAHMEEDHLALE